MAKIKEGYVLRRVAGQPVVIAVGKASEKFHGMIKLNESACCIWKGTEAGLTPEETALRLVQEFDIDISTARMDTQKMMEKMKELEILED